MIVKMKKLTLLVSEREREKFLSGLRRVGVLHIKHVKPPESHEIKFIEDRMANIDKMISILTPYRGKGAGAQMVCDEKRIIDDTVRITEIYEDKLDALRNMHDLEGQLLWFDIWGEFDPDDLAELREKGVNLRLHRLSKDEFRKLRRSKEEKYKVIKREKGYVYIAALFLAPDKKLSFEEVTPPPRGPEAIHKMMERLNARIDKVDQALAEEARVLESIKICREPFVKEHEFLTVKFGMQEEEEFSYMRGFCPADALPEVISLSKTHGAGYLIEDADVPEETPTLIRNPKWIRVIKPVFQFMNTVPGYNEFDISFVFLLFFSLFFAMLVGDAGYGLLFILITFLARIKWKKAPREPFFLMYILGGTTAVWGAITGTWFGSDTIATMPGFRDLIIGRIDSFSAENQNFIIYLCFLIGTVHLTIAHLMKAFKWINSVKALADVGWVMIVWGMFFAAGTLVIGRDFPPAGGWLLVGGMALVLVFSNAQKNMLKGILSTLVHLPLSVIGSFSDVVSYLRLFAVGYATLVLASTFNHMAFAGGINNVFAGLGAAFVLFLGHALNVLLAMMAVIVHGIRLNMLEFSGHLGMQWSGEKYEPFCER
ncbi:MAG: hypothetical protein WBC16_00035 [Candidatus Omnitrophota bacterium]